jgi:hypothetical protein
MPEMPLSSSYPVRGPPAAPWVRRRSFREAAREALCRFLRPLDMHYRRRFIVLVASFSSFTLRASREAHGVPERGA